MLAHSLRDAGTTKKLAVMVTLDSVSAEVVEQLKVHCGPPPAGQRLRGTCVLILTCAGRL